jgi:hemerythrin-like domain-containing protein
MTTATPLDSTPNVNEMRVIHRVFRRELAALPDAIRQVSDGDRRRARVVGGHVQLILAGLHMHHLGEDAELWPRLLDRAAPSADLIRTMEQQHGRVEAGLGELRPSLEQWIRTASTVHGEWVAELLTKLRGDLVEHLDLEEREILPLVERHITAAEWSKLGEHGKDSMSARQLPLMFGAIMEDADEKERAELLATLPAPIRLLMRGVGGRQYRRYITRVRTV